MADSQRIVLVGYRASGKSSLLRLLPRQLNCPGWDADVLIEQTAGCRIAQIFQAEGEERFRDLEHASLVDVLARPGPWVLASGGGVVVRPDNRDLLKESDVLVVYLKAPVEVLAARLQRSAGGRPSLTGKSPAQEVAEVLAQREPWYEEVADLVLDVSAGNPRQVCKELLQVIGENPSRF